MCSRSGRTQREIRAKEASYRDVGRLICALDQRFGARQQATPKRAGVNQLAARTSLNQ